MNFEELKKSYFLEADEEADVEAEIPPEETEDPEAELQAKIAEKMEEIGAVAADELDKVIADKTNIFINKIQSVGIDEVLADFILQKFIPSLDNIDDKLFVTVNLEEFIMFLAMKFSEKLTDDGQTVPDKKETKDK